MSDAQKETEIARKIVAIAAHLQPRVSVVGNALQFNHHSKIVKIAMFGGTVQRDRSVLAR